jgi:hypothetical protein
MMTSGTDHSMIACMIRRSRVCLAACSVLASLTSFVTMTLAPHVACTAQQILTATAHAILHVFCTNQRSHQ